MHEIVPVSVLRSYEQLHLGKETGDLYRLEAIDNSNPDIITQVAEATAVNFAKDLALTLPGIDSRAQDILKQVADKQATMVTRHSDGSWKLDQDKVKIATEHPENAAMNQHLGYVSRAVSAQTGVSYQEVRRILGNGSVLETSLSEKTLSERLAELRVNWPSNLTAESLAKAIESSYGTVKSRNDEIFLVSNLPGYLAGEAVLQYTQNVLQMTPQDLLSVLATSEEQLAQLLDSQEPQDQAKQQAIWFAISAAKLTWQVGAVEKGLMQNKPSRYSGEDKTGEVGIAKQMTTPTEMRRRIEADTAIENAPKRAVHELLKDIDQIRSYLELALAPKLNVSDTVT